MDIYAPAARQRPRHAVHLWLLGTQCGVQACKGLTVRNPRILPHLEPPPAKHVWGVNPRLESPAWVAEAQRVPQSVF